MMSNRSAALDAARHELGRCAPAPGEELLLQAALLDGDAAANAWLEWRSERSLTPAPGRSNALLPLVAAMLDSSVLAEDAPILRRHRQQAWRNLQIQLDGLRQAVEVARTVVAQPLVVKGAALADAVYPPGARTMGDADLILGPEAFEPTVHALLAAGWATPQRTSNIASARALSLTLEGGRSMDLHRWLLFPRETRSAESRLWERAVRFDVGGHTVLQPGIADAIVVAIVHGLNPRDDSAARWPADVMLLARSAAENGEPDLWRRVVEAAADVGLGVPVGKGLAYCREALGLDVGDDTLDELADIPFDRWLAAEWHAKRRGLRVYSRVRIFADINRALGQPANPIAYVKMRWGLFSEAGGLGPYARTRLARGRDTLLTQYRHRRTW